MDIDVRKAVKTILRSLSVADAIEMLMSEINVPIEPGFKASEMLAHSKAVREAAEAKAVAARAKEELEHLRIIGPRLNEVMQKIRASIRERAELGHYYYPMFVNSNYMTSEERTGMAYIHRKLEEDGFKISQESGSMIRISWGPEA